MLTDTDLATIDPPAAAAIVTDRAERDFAHAYQCAGASVRLPLSGNLTDALHTKR
jgi:hypothetical protein